MEPLGTITMCFPHVDKDTKSVLEKIMKEAENFGDFTVKLVDRVCAEPSSPLLEYFAYYFSFYITDYTLTDKLEVAGKVSDLAEPFRLAIRNSREDLVPWNEMNQAVAKALESAPNDWITSHFYLEWRFSVAGVYPELDLDVKTIETITESVYNNKDLEFFRVYLLRMNARSFFSEGKNRDALDLMNQALILVRKHDEQLMVSYLLNIIANWIKHSDVNRAIELLLSAREMSERLGYRYNIGFIQHNLAHILGLRGETNAAIDHHIEYRDICASLGLPSGLTNSVIAFYYNQIGDGEKALEFATSDNEKMASIRWASAFNQIQVAYALINLGRLEEAKDALATAHDITIRSGVSTNLMYHRTVEGILDKADRRHDAAIDCFKDVLKFIEDDPIPLYQNICLLNLTEIEIDKMTGESLEKESESSGPWMKKLFEHAEKNDLPGIAARALLLKAKLHQRQGRYKEVRKILKEVQKTAESPSMKYLNEIAISMFPDIIMS